MNGDKFDKNTNLMENGAQNGIENHRPFRFLFECCRLLIQFAKLLIHREIFFRNKNRIHPNSMVSDSVIFHMDRKLTFFSRKSKN